MVEYPAVSEEQSKFFISSRFYEIGLLITRQTKKIQNGAHLNFRRHDIQHHDNQYNSYVGATCYKPNLT